VGAVYIYWLLKSSSNLTVHLGRENGDMWPQGFVHVIVYIAMLCVGIQASMAQDGRGEPEVPVEWRVAKDQVDAIKQIVPLKEAQVYDTRNPILVGAIVLVGAVVLPQIAQAIIDVYNRYKSGGVIIDTTREPILISTNSRIAPGFALIISKDGTRLIEVGGVQPLKLDDLKAILSMAIKK
jgi:hypothetical protein